MEERLIFSALIVLMMAFFTGIIGFVTSPFGSLKDAGKQAKWSLVIMIISFIGLECLCRF